MNDTKSTSSDGAAAAFEAFQRTTRFGTVLLVVDLRGELRREFDGIVKSSAARRHVELYDKLGHAYAVVAGHVALESGCTFTCGVKHRGDLPMLYLATITAAGKLREIGETSTMVGLFVDDEIGSPLEELIAEMSSVAGSA